MTEYPERGAGVGVVSSATGKRFLKALGRRVRELRLEKGVSVEVSAHSLGVSVKHLTEVEDGARDPGLSLLEKIAMSSELRLSELVAPIEAQVERSASDSNH
jgi:transcriptional regulator with XRE-family HTH domain